MDKVLTRNFPTILVIFGATGDLMTKKIVPALFDLYEKGELPKLFTVVGYSRRPLSKNQFQDHVSQIILKYKKVATLSPTMTAFINLFHFQQGSFDSSADYLNLGKFLGQVDGEWKTCANKLFYLAVAPDHYKTIFKELESSKLTKPCSPEEGWTRVIVEKPFGKDLATAKELDHLLGKMFKEVQIYRIDHYLAKEMVQNILSFRFSNYLFEDSWNNHSIERITIRAWEKIGVEERGNFYDGVGALRDFGQNHLLQMLAFVTMDQPTELTADAIRKKRAELLKTMVIPNKNYVKNKTIRAQYDGYRNIKNVEPNSTTETYFKTKVELASPRWQGVEIILESGKRLGQAKKEVEILFKHPEPCLCQPLGEHHQNRIIFSMEPTEDIRIEFWAKKPGLKFETEKRDFNFELRQKGTAVQYVEEYRKLLLDCVNGDQTLYVSTDEIVSMWKFADPIIKGWRENVAPLHSYTPDESAISAQTPLLSPVADLPKTIGIIGLGKMGANLTRRLMEKGWNVVGYNRSPEKTHALEKEGMTPAFSIRELVEKLPAQKIIWLMLPAGKTVDDMLFDEEGVVTFLKRGGIIIDGGNSFYKDTLRRSQKVTAKGIHYLDVGTSGGPAGARHGACLMIGGKQNIYEKLEPLFKALAKNNSYQFFGFAGAGHFVKMVHNGIEYGMMQAIAEGFAILKKSRFKLNLTDVAEIYNNGSVIESRLVGWMKKAFELHGENLKGVSGKVSHTGEGAWTVQTAHDLKMKAKIIEEALKFRIQSKKNPDFTGQAVSALREQFGGHSVTEEK